MEPQLLRAWSQALESQGLKKTKGRLKLLEVLQKEKKPVSVAFLIKKMRGALDHVSVYRALETLRRAGMVRAVDLRHGHLEYEIAREHHHHVVCTSCQAIEDVRCVALPSSKLLLKQSKRFVQIEDHALEFFGTCTTCATK